MKPKRKLHPPINAVAWAAVILGALILVNRPAESPYDAIVALRASEHPVGSIVRHDPELGRFSPFYLVHLEEGVFVAHKERQGPDCLLEWLPLAGVEGAGGPNGAFQLSCSGKRFDRAGFALDGSGDHLAGYAVSFHEPDGVVVEMDKETGPSHGP